MNDFLRILAMMFGVMLYSLLFDYLAKRSSSRRARGEATLGEKLREKSYIFGRKLGRYLAGQRGTGIHLVTDATLKRTDQSR